MNKIVILALQRAISTEAVGHEFYRKAAAMVADEKGKAVLMQLAKEENQHMAVLSALLDSAAKKGKWLTYEEACTLGEPLLDEIPVFTEEIGKKLSPDTTERKILKTAMDVEEEAEKFYKNLAEQTDDNAGRSTLKRLAEMEKQHYNILKWEYDSVTASGFWCDIMEFSVEKEQ